MKTLPLVIAIGITLTACHNPPIKPEPAKTVPPNTQFNKLKVETLSTDVRKALRADDERDLVLILKADGGAILYGAPGRGFRKGTKGEIEHYLEEMKKKDKKVEVVNSIQLRTLRASPACDWYDDGIGNIVWYFDGCPNF